MIVVYLCFHGGCIFAEYDLFKSTISIQNCIYMNFRINLTQFSCISISRDSNIDITFMGHDQDWLSAYTPFHFSFTVPLIYH